MYKNISQTHHNLFNVHTKKNVSMEVDTDCDVPIVVVCSSLPLNWEHNRKAFGTQTQLLHSFFCLPSLDEGHKDHLPVTKKRKKTDMRSTR